MAQSTKVIALRQKTKNDELIETVEKPALGLPLKAFPEWKVMPLFIKLPTFPVPSANRPILTREKVGNKLWKPESGLDDCNSYAPQQQYEPVHDQHLKYFWSREPNLKYLRKIGQLTDEKDIICNARDFNMYRNYLFRCHLNLIRDALKKKDEEEHDRYMLQNAENIAKKENKRAKRYQGKNSLAEKIEMKKRLERERRAAGSQAVEKYNLSLQRCEEMKKFKYEQMMERHRLLDIESNQKRMKTMRAEYDKRNLLREKIRVREAHRIKRAKEYCQIKKNKENDMSLQHWEKWQLFRQKYLENNLKALEKYQANRLKNIEKRKKKMQKLWQNQQQLIIKKSLMMQRKIRKRAFAIRLQKHVNGSQTSSASKVKLKQVYDAINTALTLHKEEKIPAIGIESSAQHILENVINTQRGSLFNDKSYTYMCSRVEDLLTYTKDHVIQKVMQILTADRMENKVNKRFPTCVMPKGHAKISFGRTMPIGTSSLIITSETHIRGARNRPPTPASSFTGLHAVVKHNEDDEFKDSQLKTDWTSDEQIFVEHLFITFKKALFVNAQKAVFAAIDKNKKEIIVRISREMLEMDKIYLKTIIAESILNFNVNSYNFYANLDLAVNVISADVLYDLQNSTLKPKYGIQRNKIDPYCRCTNVAYSHTIQREFGRV